MMLLLHHSDVIYALTTYKNASIQAQSFQSAMKSISSAKQDLIISLLNSGLSTRAVASQTGVSKSKVCNIAKEMLPNKENLKAGRPSILSPRDKRAISMQIQSGRAETAVEIAQNLNPTFSSPVSVQTIRNALKKDDFKAVAKKKKPYLSARHRKQCLAFALKYQNWTLEDWKRVIWSDETKINRFGSDGKKYVWKKRQQPLLVREVDSTVKHGGGNIMVWACMGWNGVGIMVEVEGRMNADQYVHILEEGLLESIQNSGIPEEDVIFQQDNDPKHTSGLATNFFNEQNINVLDWPAQSPDLNPIEHLWILLKKLIYGYDKPPSGVFELWDRAAEQWGNITAEQCQALIESMPRRLEAVIKAKGGNIKY